MRLNFLWDLAQALVASQLTASLSQQELALIMREARKKTGWWETETGISEPHSLLHNAFSGHAHVCGVPPDQLILNNKCHGAKSQPTTMSSVSPKPRISTLESIPTLSATHTLSKTHAHFHLTRMATAHGENSGSSH